MPHANNMSSNDSNKVRNQVVQTKDPAHDPIYQTQTSSQHAKNQNFSTCSLTSTLDLATTEPFSLPSVNNIQSSSYTASSTTLSSTENQEISTLRNFPYQKRIKFKNSELIVSHQSPSSNEAKKSTSHSPATCQLYAVVSQKSFDLDDFSDQYHEHVPFKLLDIDERELYSTTIIKINPNDLNRRLTSLKRGADSISKEEILRVLHLNQQQASSRLGCSVSTLKRKFYVLREVRPVKVAK